MTDPFDTQKVRLDLMKELLQVQEKAIQETNVSVLTELAGKIRWLQGKLDFLDSPEYEKRRQWMDEKDR